MDVNILFMMVLATLIPDTRDLKEDIRPKRAYLISGMREGVKTVKIQHVSVATCTGHVTHMGHV